MSQCLIQFLGRFIEDTGLQPSQDIIVNVENALNAFENNAPEQSQGTILTSAYDCIVPKIEDQTSVLGSEIVEAIITILVITIIIVTVCAIVIIYDPDRIVVVFIAILLFLLVASSLIILSLIRVDSSTVEECIASARTEEEILNIQFFQAINAALCAY